MADLIWWIKQNENFLYGHQILNIMVSFAVNCKHKVIKFSNINTLSSIRRSEFQDPGRSKMADPIWWIKNEKFVFGHEI